MTAVKKMDVAQSRLHSLDIGARSTLSDSQYECPVAAPYRLDLTVSVLRRLSTNVVDVLTPEGQYVRALGGSREPVIVRVTPVHPKALTVALGGDEREHGRLLAVVRRVLGVDRGLAHFDNQATSVPWLKSLAERMRGVKPPRYPTLWEACVNAIVFQQVSLSAASAIMRRLIVALGASLDSDGMILFAFPTVERVLGAEDALMRGAGLSLAKLTTLRRVGEGLITGALNEAMLEERPSPEAAKLLCGIRGCCTTTCCSRAWRPEACSPSFA